MSTGPSPVVAAAIPTSTASRSLTSNGTASAVRPAAPQLLRHGASPVAVAIVHDDGGALARKRGHDTGANPLPCTVDKRHLASQVERNQVVHLYSDVSTTSIRRHDLIDRGSSRRGAITMLS